MNRGYTREQYLDRIRELRAACPRIALSTDVIVGFPSETSEDFEDTMQLLERIEFDSIFAFAYSNRSSAPASRFKEQVDEAEKKDRLNRLLAFQETITERKNQARVGKQEIVLVEGKSARPRNGFSAEYQNMEQMSGRSESNKVVHFPSNNARIGDMIKVTITHAYPHSLWGRPAELTSE